MVPFLCTQKITECQMEGVISKEKYVTIGLPHDFILGHLVFILFVNDYPTSLKHSTVNIYACVFHNFLEVIERKDDLLNSMQWMPKTPAIKLTINLK